MPGPANVWPPRGNWVGGCHGCVFAVAVTATRAAEAVRAHWRLENTSRFARLRSSAFDILKANQTGTPCQDRYRASPAGTGTLFKMLAVPQR